MYVIPDFAISSSLASYWYAAQDPFIINATIMTQDLANALEAQYQSTKKNLTTEQFFEKILAKYKQILSCFFKTGLVLFNWNSNSI
jgi:hypothetical protein